MASATQNLVRSILRKAGPLTVDEIVARLGERAPRSKNPKQTIANAITNDLTVERADGRRYCYLPAFVRGASVRADMGLAVAEKGLVAWSAEAIALLWHAPEWSASPLQAALALEGGPTVTVSQDRPGFFDWLYSIVRLPTEFWSWWAEQRRAGADALRIYCEDGEAGRFTGAAARTAALDAAAVAARTVQLRDAAAGVLNRTRGLRPSDLVRRVLARGVYHGEPAPDPLAVALFEPPGPFVRDNSLIGYRPELTPTLRRLFADRLAEQNLWEQALIHDLLGLPPPEAPEPEDEDQEPVAIELPAQAGYRLKVSLQWKKSVWRVVEILDNQALEDLHLTIQDAFDWDNDHLYAFFLSGKAWDRLTMIESPFGEPEPPTTDEVLLADLELTPGQRFLYLFDFGDDLRHDVEVLGTFPPPATGTFPRIVVLHGQAPPQYPTWDEDAE